MDATNPTQGVLQDAWELYRRHWQHFASLSLAVYLVIAALSALLTLAVGLLGALVAAALSIIGLFLLQGAIVTAVEDVRDQQVDLSLGQTFQAARPHLGRIALTSVIAGLGIALGLLLVLVPGLYLLTVWSVAVPVVVLEGRGAAEALGRSRSLVRGHGWNVFGLMVLTFLVLFVVTLVIGIILAPLPTAAAEFVGDLISGAIIGPWVAIVWALLYYRLRDRALPSL